MNSFQFFCESVSLDGESYSDSTPECLNREQWVKRDETGYSSWLGKLGWDKNPEERYFTYSFPLPTKKYKR